MNRNRLIAIIMLLALSLGAGNQALAQQPVSKSNDTNGSARSGDEIQLSKLLAQARPKRRPFFTPETSNPNLAGHTAGITPSAGPTLPVTGSGTVGRMTKWGGFTSSNSVIGDSTIYEDKFGMVGIGTDAPTSKLTVMGLIESKGAGAGVRFQDGTVQTTAFDTNQVVRSLNMLSGDLFLTAGANITITPAANSLTIASPGSLNSVSHDPTLIGSGTPASLLGVVNGGIGNAQLANGAVTAAKIAPNQVVTTLNNLKDNVTLAAGSNITITPSGNTLTIAGAAGSIVAYNQNNGAFLGPLNNPGQVVISKTVPAGSYLIFFKCAINNFDSDPQVAQCTLSTGDIDSKTINDATMEPMVLHDAETFSAETTITVRCSGFKLFSFNHSLTALKVDSIQ